MKKVVLGIDPGLRYTGYSVIVKNEKKSGVADFGYLKLEGVKDLSKRVHMFHQFFVEKIEKFGVTTIALETPFLGKNAQTFLKLGYLRGILYLLAQQHGCTLCEFAPREIKVSVTGFGGATKDQVALMVARMVPGIGELSKTVRNDVTDALAVGICGLWHG